MDELKKYRTYVTEDCKHHVTVKIITPGRVYVVCTIDNNLYDDYLPVYIEEENNEEYLILPHPPLCRNPIIFRATRYYA
jgi:hypothetical protein